MQFYVVRHPGVVMYETRVLSSLTPGCWYACLLHNLKTSVISPMDISIRIISFMN